MAKEGNRRLIFTFRLALPASGGAKLEGRLEINLNFKLEERTSLREVGLWSELL